MIKMYVDLENVGKLLFKPQKIELNNGDVIFVKKQDAAPKAPLVIENSQGVFVAKVEPELVNSFISKLEAGDTHKSNVRHIGYRRVSTILQKTDRQLEGVPLDIIYEEKTTAKTIQRPELEAAKKACTAGDVLHIHSLDRVCRSGSRDAIELVEELNARGVTVQFHKENMIFDGSKNPVQKMILSILAAVAEMELERINERRLEGIAIAKMKGTKFGRKRIDVDMTGIEERLQAGEKPKDLAKELGIGRSKFYTLLKEVRENGKNSENT